MSEEKLTNRSGEDNYTVLVVEDEPGLLKVLGQYLTMCGCRAIKESDGYSALQHLSDPDKLPDLILTDISLPGLDGYDLLEHVREEHPGLPVIFLTGHMPESVLQNGKLKPDAVLKKPVGLKKLGEVVFGILKK